jgi:hypothetical protein
MQGLLGTSKNNTIFSVRDNIEENKKDVFWGFNKFTSVPNNKRSISFQSAIAFLYEAGIAPRHIEQNFKVSFKTIKKWHGTFLSTESVDELKDKLRAPGRETYKIDENIRDFILKRVEYYKKENVWDFNVKTVADVEKKYGIEICVETVRREYKKAQEEKNIKKEADSPVIPDMDDSEEGINKGSANREVTSEDAGDVFRNAYAGVLLLSAWIGKVLSGLNNLKDGIQNMITIWLFGIILGCKNLEQFRYFRQADFKFISMVDDVPGVESLRKELKELSIRDDIKLSSLFTRSMINNFRNSDGNDFYLDGHVVEYSGKENILEGWNTRKNRVMKGYVLYFVHDGEGNPLFSLTFDHFYDFREVIRMAITKIKKLTKSSRFVLIYDRGGFSHELMKEIGEAGGSFISWEKGFKKEEVENEITFKDRMVMEYPYNDVGKTNEYEIYFHEMVYRRDDFECRRILIRRKGIDGKKLYQSILTSEREADAVLVIRKLLKRFVQENDFKKLKGQFGLDEITGYGKLKYNELKDKVDKETLNTEYRKKLIEIAQLKQEKALHLKKLGVKVLKAYKRKAVRKTEDEEIIVRIIEIEKRIKELKGEMKGISKKISKIEKCRCEGKRELDLRPKRIMDLVRIAARNIFNSGASEFLSIYENLRDYQKVFRLLTRCSGEIQMHYDMMNVRLDRFGGKKFQKKCDDYFTWINSIGLKTYNGTHMLHFGWRT